MPRTTDPNEVRLTGENSHIWLCLHPNGPVTTRAQHWRVLFSPAGSGHVLFLESELTGSRPRIWADNIALARWLQEEIERTIYPAFSDNSIPVSEATFSKLGDLRSFWTEKVLSEGVEISMTWYDFCEPFVVHLPPGITPERPHGVYNVHIPARKAQLLMNGEPAQGHPLPDPQDRDGYESTKCSLAFSETWVRPRSLGRAPLQR